MGNIAIDQLHNRIVGQLDPYVRSRIKMRIVEISDALVVTVDGDNCISSVSVWSNGCCDAEYLYVATEQGESSHYEFEDMESASQTVLREINLAVERA